MASLSRQLRFRDLQELGVLPNRMTLHNWVKNAGFPPGRLVGPNTRLWSETEVVAWLESRPSDTKVLPVRKISAAAA